MTLSALIRQLEKFPHHKELIDKLNRDQTLKINGISRLPKGLLASSIASTQQQNLLILTATLEEANRWIAQLELIGCNRVLYYPTSESSPYDPYDPEPEMIWGQFQVLADLLINSQTELTAIVTTVTALQPHLVPSSVFRDYCISLPSTYLLEQLCQKLAQLGYQRVPLVETEGQWSRRGDIIDIFPVSAELPVRLEWFGDQLEQMREFDPNTQRSQNKLNQIILTPTDYSIIIQDHLNPNIDQSDQTQRQLLAQAFPQPDSIIDYLPDNTLIVLDEPEQLLAHAKVWLEPIIQHKIEPNQPLLYQDYQDCLSKLTNFPQLQLSQFETEDRQSYLINTIPILASAHQFAKLANIIRENRQQGHSVWLISAQPSRTVSLLSEHDCPSQFIPNPKDYPAIDKLLLYKTPIALKYSGGAQLEGFILPMFRLTFITDKEFFGQHSLANPSFLRKQRRGSSAKQIDPNKLHPGDYVVHKNHGIGQFVQLESLTINQQTREYLVIKYADGILRVAADQVDMLSRYRTSTDSKPELHKMSGKAWLNTKNKVKKAIKKVAFDLLTLYAQRSQNTGYAFPPDSPWQQELEDSFPYLPTPDQLKATLEVKQDMESDRPMDRLVCGDVGFGKTEVAIRAIFKAVVSGKQVAILAPTTILTQQHYHTLKERFAPYPIEIGLLNRFRTSEERKKLLQNLTSGKLDIVVGTHQLLSDHVIFKSLGLLVIDEEQRFGVNHKEKIKSFRSQIDVLTLSATPIPRTLYMALSGMREMSLITTPPPSRRPIRTHLCPYKTTTIGTAIRQELDRGGQVFYVVPRVQGIDEKAAMLQELVPQARLAVAHGQMPETELESTMLTFSNGEAEILICTTIIESGLDIPRVNTIIIEDAQKFGLSQLYQLRGRVGRSGIQAHAWLLYPNQTQLTDTAKERLNAIQEFAQLGSGYQLAMRDMEIRGVGNLLGAEQSGQLNAIGFDLYIEMLEETVKEIKGQEIPSVEETQIELNLTAFIPNEYITDLDQKISIYRAIAAATTKKELELIALELRDRYGEPPSGVIELLKIIELKQIAKKLGFYKIKPDSQQNIILETKMEQPAWNLLAEQVPENQKNRFIYSKGKVTIRGLGVMKPAKQLTYLIEQLSQIIPN